VAHPYSQTAYPAPDPAVHRHEVMLSSAGLARCYAQMLRIRRTGEEIIRLHPAGKTQRPVHLGMGQEAVAVALCDHLRVEDVLFATDRGHAAYLAKGGDIDALWAGLYGKATGCGRGIAGAMRPADLAVNMMGTSAIVAASIPEAVGYALGGKTSQDGRIVVCLFSEGAADQGVTHESLNFASLRRLPILFVCESDEYAVSSSVSVRPTGYGLCERVRALGIPYEKEESGDFLAMHETAGRGVADVRKGLGPRFIEVRTTGWHDQTGEDGHPEDGSDARLNAEDQLARIARLLADDTRGGIEAGVEREIAAAIAFAESSLFPEDEDVFEHVFAARG
jgi:TPP-dependent pyruvate/acetoin dehydrogenase alpha subunit